MQSEIQTQVDAFAAEKIESEQTQKTNLEEMNHHKHHVSKQESILNQQFFKSSPVVILLGAFLLIYNVLTF